MAFMNQERKKERAPAIKKVLKKYGVKGSIGVRNYSTLVVKVKDVAGMFAEFFKEGDYFQREYGMGINPYHYDKHFANNPVAVKFLDELTTAMYGVDYFDESNAMTDYFHRSHYIDIDVFQVN